MYLVNKGAASRCPGRRQRDAAPLICFAATELSVIDVFQTDICRGYNDKNAGQALLRVRRRVMDLRVILDNGGEGCPIAAYNDMLFR